MKKVIPILAVMILLCRGAGATPVTALEQAQQQGVTVSVTSECCDEHKVPLWPLVFLAAVPLAFIHGSEDMPTPPVIVLTTPTPEIPKPVPEPSSLIFGLGLFFAAALLRKRRAALAVVFVLATVGVAEAKPKGATVIVFVNVPVRVALDDEMSTVDVTQIAFHGVKAGDHVVTFALPGGAYQETVSVGKDCTVRVRLSYTPPIVRQQIHVEPVPSNPGPCVIRIIPDEKKPAVAPWIFDRCCSCKRDDLKARLDLFAVELQRDPKSRARVVTSNSAALDYLEKVRGIDRERLIGVFSVENCVELWIVP